MFLRRFRLRDVGPAGGRRVLDRHRLLRAGAVSEASGDYLIATRRFTSSNQLCTTVISRARLTSGAT